MPIRVAPAVLLFLLSLSSARTAAARELTLEAAVDEALRHHTHLEASRQRVAGKAAALDAQRALFDTSSTAALSAESGERHFVPGTRALGGALALAKRTRLGTTVSAGVDYEFADAGPDGAGVAGLGLRVVQPLLGGLGEAVGTAPEREAEATLAHERSKHDESTAQRIHQVAVRYWQLVSAQAIAAKLVEAKGRADKLLEETRVLVRAHERPATDLHMLEASSAGHAHNRMAAERSVADAAHALANALGGGVAPVATTPLPDVAPDAPAEDRDDDWVRRALRSRPVISAHRDRVAAAAAAQIAAADRTKPRLNLAFDLRLEHQDIDPDLVAVDGSSVLLSLESDLPFSNPAGDAEERAAQAALQEAKALQKGAERAVAVQVRRALSALRASRAVLERAKTARSAYVQALRAERAKLKAGFSTVFQVTILEERLTTAELLRLQAWGRYMGDMARLWFATGSLVGLNNPGDALLSAPLSEMKKDG